jgi:hypothetical protein
MPQGYMSVAGILSMTSLFSVISAAKCQNQQRGLQSVTIGEIESILNRLNARVPQLSAIFGLRSWPVPKLPEQEFN